MLDICYIHSNNETEFQSFFFVHQITTKCCLQATFTRKVLFNIQVKITDRGMCFSYVLFTEECSTVGLEEACSDAARPW